MPPSTMPSFRKQVHDALIAALQTITTTNGYNSTIQQVYKKDVDISTVTSFPAVACFAGITGKQQDSGDQKLYYARSMFIARGFVSAAADASGAGLLTDAYDSLSQDIQNCLMQWSENSAAWLTLEGTSTGAIKNLNLISDDPVFDFKNNRAWFDVMFMIEWVHDDQV